MILLASKQAPPRSRFSPLRAAAYRALNQERRASGLAPYTLPQLNSMTVWEMMQETISLCNSRKPAPGLWDSGGSR